MDPPHNGLNTHSEEYQNSLLPAMATSRDAPNPLRPYYIPPSIGLPPDLPQNQTSGPSYSSSLHKPSFGSQARDILSDLDYDSYFADSSPSVTEHARRLLDQALWNYTSVLLAQPFEVAKTILQIHQASGQAPPGLLLNGEELRSRPNSFASGKYEDYPSDEESDEESPGYFTTTAPRLPEPFSPTTSSSRSPDRRRRYRDPSRSNASTPTQAPPTAHRKLELKKPDALLEVISQVWQKESAWGVWKGTNVTFIYNFLFKTTESWTRSLLSALLNVPDPGLMGASASGIGGLDIVDSNNPLLSLAVAVAASAIAAIALGPLDLIRTRLIVTPTSAPPRTIWPSFSLLPSLTIPSTLIPATLLHSALPTLISSSAPLFLRSTFAIDPVLTPSTYSFATFLSATAELFVRLPIETVLRRGQVAVLQEHENQRLSDAYRNLKPTSRSSVYGLEDEDPSVRSFKTIVEPGPYRGILGTMWYIIREEGVQITGPSTPKMTAQQQRSRTPGFSARTRVRKGQGIHGLWRGWRVGFWGLAGVWGAAALGGGGGEF